MTLGGGPILKKPEDSESQHRKLVSEIGKEEARKIFAGISGLASGISRGGKPWNQFDRALESYLSYYKSAFPGLDLESKIKNAGNDFSVLDIAGAIKATKFNQNVKTVNVVLPLEKFLEKRFLSDYEPISDEILEKMKNEVYPKDDYQNLLMIDALSVEGREKIRAALQKIGAQKFNTIFFRPGDGMKDFDENQYSQEQFLELLKLIPEILLGNDQGDFLLTLSPRTNKNFIKSVEANLASGTFAKLGLTIEKGNDVQNHLGYSQVNYRFTVK